MRSLAQLLWHPFAPTPFLGAVLRPLTAMVDSRNTLAAEFIGPCFSPIAPMAAPPRAASAADDFHQLQLLFTDPVQHDYEVIRPLLLFAETATQRSVQTGVERTTISAKAGRFVQHGMLGLADQRPTKAGRKPQTFPEAIASYILYLKLLYPPIHHREIVRILQRKYGFHTNHHTVANFLARHALPVQLPLQWTLFHQFEDAYRARWWVVRLYYEGWQKQSIAGCLQLSRQHVHQILAAFARDGFAGLEDQRSRPADHPANQMTLPLLKEVLDLQREYPRAGRFRVRGLLAQQRADQEPPSLGTVARAMARNRQFHRAPPPWVRAKQANPPPDEPKQLRYVPQYPHQYWFIDLRYLVQLESKWTYSLCILEGYSRQILVGTAAEHQDGLTVLQLLHAAVDAYGCPEGLVSDNGSIFTAQDYRAILAALEISPCYIEKGKPWQNLIEAQFKVQLRLADAKFEQATTFAAVQTAHAGFVETFNTTLHWAHRQRPAGSQTPAAVLQAASGRRLAPAELDRLFKTTQLTRTVSRHGCVSIQRFYIYAERGLARQRVAVWVYEGQLRLEYEQTLLARYHCVYDRQLKQLQTVDQPRLYQTPFASPQLELWELDEEQWLKVQQRPFLPHRARHRPSAVRQLALLGFGLAGSILLAELVDLWHMLAVQLAALL